MTQPVASLVEDAIGVVGIDVSLSLIDNTQRIPNVPLLSPQTEFISQIPIIGSAVAAGASEWYALIGLALLLMSPKFVDMVRDAFKVKPFPYGPELGIIGAPMAGIKKGFETSITQTTQPVADVYTGRAMDAAKRIASIGRRRSGGGTGGGTGTPPPPPGP